MNRNLPASSVQVSARLPAGVLALGMVSFFMDMSSELVHCLLPLLLVGEMGVSGLLLGVLEGVAEATAQAVKVYSGSLSDRWGKRKQLILWGYGLAAITKPLFPLATGFGLVFAARVIDRVGKGIRGAPRDALLSEMVPPAQRGRAFGLRQSMDTWGAVAGPLLAMGLIAWWQDLRLVLWVAVIPAALAVICIFIWVPDMRSAPRPVVSPLSLAGMRTLGRPFWWVVVLGGCLSLTRFSEAFLLLRAQQQGLATVWVPGVLILMSAVYALAAYPAGIAADRISKKHLLLMGTLVMALANMLLATVNTLWGVAAGIVCWGLHMALTQGLMAHLVADVAPDSLKATAFGFFNLATAAALIIASLVAGILWDQIGATGPFWFGLLGCGATLVAMAGLQHKIPALAARA